jgi:ribonuclease P/MRP protein subunit RPP1
MYEAVHARPDGDATVARYAHDVAAMGYDGVVVRNHGDARARFDADAVADEFGVDVVTGMEVRADDPSQASGYVGNYRPKHELLCVHGGTVAMNRFACEQERVDVLCHPMRGDGDLNHVMVKAAVENGVRIELDLSGVLRRSGGRRVQAVQALRKCHELVDYYDAPFVVSADPTSHLQLRAPRELVAVGEQVGLAADEVEAGLAEWGRLADRNRERSADAFIEPGVRRGRYEEDDR